MVLAGLLQAASVTLQEMPPADERVMPTKQNQIFSFSEAIDKAKDSIVYIATTQTTTQEYLNKMDPLLEQFFGRRYHPGKAPKRASLGSGVIVSADGYIITNNHVVEDADSIMVKVPGSEKEYAADVIGTDPKSDLTVIKIEAQGLKPIMMGQSSNLKIGDVVFAIGNPFGVGLSVTQGIISAQNKDSMGINEYENFIQTDASINPGNSGGALVDSRGALIGINTAIITRSGGNNGIGFAIEVDMVKNIAKKLIENGSIERGYMGVAIGNLTKELRKLYKHEDGALVIDITPESPAENAGLKRGDLIVRIDDHDIKDSGDLKNIVGMYLPDTRIKVEYERDGKTDFVFVKLDNLADNDIGENKGMIEGLTLENLDEKYRYRLRIPDDVEGVLVTEVDPKSEAGKQDILPGDVIVQVEKTVVASVKELSKALKQHKDKYKRIYIYRSGRVFVVAVK